MGGLHPDMVVKKLFVTALMCMVLKQTGAQTLQLLKASELNQRISNASDSFFVINFWATWCAPCVQEIPEFNRFSDAHGKDAVKVLMVSVDKPTDKNIGVKKFTGNHRFSGELILLNETDQQKYIDEIHPSWSGTIPATLFVYKGRRRFAEEEFSKEELEKIYMARENL